jgi:hypothetical protein
MIIVTRNQYICAQKIHHVLLDEEIDTINLSNGRDLLRRKYMISVVYTAESQAQNSREDNRECNVIVYSRKEAYLLFKDLCNQIREQSPDAHYLNKVLENFLSEEEIAEIGKLDDEELFKKEMKERLYDPSSKKLRSVRETKRKHKRLLPKAKKRSRRSS